MKKRINKTLVILVVFALMVPSARAQQEAEDYRFQEVVRLQTTSVKDQDHSGTCWCYATLSFLETELLRMDQPAHNLSEMYLVRHAYMQKAKDYVRFHGENNFSQGGQAHDVTVEWIQHGIVPQDVYPGLEYGTQDHKHGELATVMGGYLESVVEDTRKPLTPAWDEGFARILDSYFGEVPTEFEYQGKTYTPQSFAESLEIQPNDYVELTSFSHHPWYKAFDLEVPDNWAHKPYYNLPLDELVEVIDHSLEQGYSVVWDGDVSSDGFSHTNGIAVVPANENSNYKQHPVREKQINQQMRQQQFNRQIMTDDHLMHLTGIARDQKNTRYYLTKNSWNTDSNAFGGFLYMSKPFIRLNTVAIMVHKDAIPDDIAGQLNLD